MKGVINSRLGAGESLSLRLDEQLLAACTEYGDSAAVIDEHRTVTFRDLAAMSGEISQSLRECGRHSGLPIVVPVDNRWSDVVAQLAVWRVGGVVVPVHRDTPARVLSETLQRTGARHLLSPVAAVPHDWLADTVENAPWIHCVDQVTAPPPAELDAHQALVAFTSGSTGQPKGVVLSHSAFAAKLRAICEVLPFGPGTRTLQVLQPNFTFGQWTTLVTLLSGATVDLVPRFDAADVLSRLLNQRVDRIAVVPTMLRLLLAAVDDPPPGLDPAAVVGCSSPGLWIAGGEPLAAGLGRRVLATFPRTQLADVFGLSETSTSDLILTPDAYEAGAGTIGRPSPGVQVRVVNAEGTDQPDGDVGELWIQTPFLMTGYLDDPDATSEAMSGDWFRTGDLARFTGSGAVELVGRSRFLILRGGHKISPLAIEDVLSQHPDCRGVCAFGIPDAMRGERIGVLFRPAAASTATPSQIRTWAKTRMPRHEVPDVITLIDEIPLGRTGKMDRARAYELHQAAVSNAS
ncbi:MAG: class I adenylate-forming enzyme family protein [Dermatophilaceae bacterium]